MMSIRKRLANWYEDQRNRFTFIALRNLIRKKKGMMGSLLLILVFFCALFAPYISPYNPNEMHLDEKTMPPNNRYLLGTDIFGRDLLSRVIWGARVSIYVGVISVSVGLILGILIGLPSGYYGGLLDEIVMRIMDVLLTFPAIFLALILVAVFGFNVGNLMIAIGIVFTPQFSRIIRGSVLSEVNKGYVEAAKACGYSDMRIMFREVLPNCLAPIMVQTTMFLATAILYEALMSFLGVGVQPPTPAWGYMLNEGKNYMTLAPWITFFPGLAIFVAVMAFNLFGDVLRDVLDPKLFIQ
jgi:peptide/nickel transport system permease protein